MTHVCSICEVEKSKSHMQTIGLNGGSPICKACYSMTQAADEFVAMRVITRVLSLLDADAKQRVLFYIGATSTASH